MKYTELEEVAGEDHNGSGPPDAYLQDVTLEESSKTSGGTSPRHESDTLVSERKGLRYLVTAEPVIVLFQVAVGLMMPALNALTYERVCHMTFNDTDICENLKNESYKEYEDIVQTKASHWYITQHLSFEAPALLLCFFYGSLGDHFSRRVALALPCVGQCLAALIFVVVAYNKTMHVGWISLGLLVLGLFGGWITLLLASYSLISEVSRSENRTFRISMGEGIESLSLAVSLATSGIILEHTSYEFIFFLGSALLVFAIVYCFTWLKEPPRYVKSGKPTCERLGAVFKIRRVKEAVTTVFKQRENRGRKRLLLLLLSLLIGMLSYYAMYSVGYLYLKKSPLGWSQSLYGYYSGYNRLIVGLASLVIVPVFKDILHLPDTTILLVGLLSSSLSELFLSFSTKTWMVFLVPPIGIFAQAKYTCYRSLMSQLVRSEELGKMFAMIGALQSISGIAGSSLYNTIYPKTLNFWPGFCFSLGMIVSIIPISMTIWLHCDFKKYGAPPRVDSADEGYSLVKQSDSSLPTDLAGYIMSESEEEELFVLQSACPSIR